MARIIQYVKRTKAKGHTYYYFDTGQDDENGKRIWNRLPDPSDKSWGSVYAAMLGHRSRRQNVIQQLTLAKLIELYQASKKFRELAGSTQRSYVLYQRELIDKLGSAPAQLIERKDMVLLLDRMADKPGAANMVRRAGGALYTWARKRGHVTNDPFFEIDGIEGGSYDPWPDSTLLACLSADDDYVRLCTNLLYYTAQRIGDVAALRWTDIKDGFIHMTQQKTGKELEIPLHTDLAAELAKHPRSLTTIIPGKPVESKKNKIRLALQAAVAPVKVVPHGLRKNAVIALLEAGCSAAETAAISGQSLQMVEYYARARSQKKLGQSAMLKWQGTK